MLEALTVAFAAAKLPQLTWYQATRRTYGGRFVSNGGSLERLRLILGHSSTEVTQRYGHLVRDQFSEAERPMADVHAPARHGAAAPRRAEGPISASELRYGYGKALSSWPSTRNPIHSDAVARPDLVTGPVFKTGGTC
jgi:hypothetical protein